MIPETTLSLMMHKLKTVIMTFVLVLLFLNFARGLNETTTKSNQRVVGGESVEKREDFPYQASIRVIFGRHFCGGSIITSQHILTAAHCCFDWRNVPIHQSYYKVVVGDLNIYITSQHTVVRDVAAIKYHDNYRPDELKNDIAVMKLDRNLTEWTPFINKIELATMNLEPGKVCTVSGWGALVEGGSNSEWLQMVQIPVLSRSICKEMYDADIETGMICAGYAEGKKDSCKGDSGGPLVCDGVLYGVVSWGKGCARPWKVGVYTDVNYYRDWVFRKGLTAGAITLQSLKSVPLLCVVYYYLQ